MAQTPRCQERSAVRARAEWVIGRKNKPSEVENKSGAYRVHLKDAFGSLRLDKIGTGEIARFRASLVKKQLSDKRINNILTVLSKALRYAADVEGILRAPKIGLFKVERPEIVAWEIDETMLYVHVAEVHRRELAPVLVEAAKEADWDRRVLRMLEYRHLVPWQAAG